MSRKFVVQKLKIASILLVILLLGTGLMGDKTKIKYHAQQIIKLADSDLGLIKEYPAYKVPDLSKLHQDIPREWIRQLWCNFFNPKSAWTVWEDMYNHGTKAMGFSHEQIVEIGKALGFLKGGNPAPSKLVVKNRRYYYGNDGTEPITLIGAFPRQLLHVIKGYAGEIPWTPEEYIEKAILSGINYVRLNVVDDYDLTYRFAKNMEINGIIVEYTMADGNEGHFGDYKEHIKRLKSLNNVIIEVWNEFCQPSFEYEDIDKATEIASYALSQGMLVSGGAWGNSNAGEKMSEYFREQCEVDIWTIHRPYPPLSVLESHVNYTLNRGFAVNWNEVLMKPYPTGIEPQELEAYARALADKKASVMLYLRCEEFFGLMGDICKEFNK